MNITKHARLLSLACFFMAAPAFAQNGLRKSVSLDADWMTVANDTNKTAFQGFEKNSFSEKGWVKVDVPHTWDQYGGYRRLMHGNRHGYAWYRKTFKSGSLKPGKRYFLFFEGVSSYATVYLNGKLIGKHAGGRTTFTIDVTPYLAKGNNTNLLAVKADHPADIRDLPWVCGGCSEERGFSEGSQPMGIFRPVQLIETNDLRIEPFGVHIWNDEKISERSAILNIETEVKNYGSLSAAITVDNKLLSADGKVIASLSSRQTLAPGRTALVKQVTPAISKPHLWSLEDPYLYSLVTEVKKNGKLIDRITTPYGIRWISWPVGREGDDKKFYLNGKPVLINGVGEYEHLMGTGHAFTTEQIHARAMQMKATGFNAFRDAHQPHNLRYQDYWDKTGILWWPQMSAHIWFDNPAFRTNFKQLLVDWVKERRNSPSIILWGLQNESTMPEDFARECSDIIRSLDPTASKQRLITTCNGGKGTDWDVPQNWTGTYGGNPALYGEDLNRQVLIGEYGAWRTLGLHTEGVFKQNGELSEDRMTQLMELKVRLAEESKDKTSGHFFWIFNSHDNPGRVQGGEGIRELDRIGPVNYKGLLTSWEEPADVFYMFRGNFADKATDPMVYIVSHTWPDRWLKPGVKDSITVYSNCDEVELFNDINGASLGKKTRNGIGTHFQWDKASINYNVLYAVGYVKGKAVATDCIVLNHLPKAPHFDILNQDAKNITKGTAGYHYLYRVNCGGPEYTDENGNVWMADKRRSGNNTWGSLSWTEEYAGMPAFFASQRSIPAPVKGTKDWALFQTLRYGREKLKYEFPVADGEYLVELYFAEPWFGVGGGKDFSAWRLFDVALNGNTVLHDLDLWKEAGVHGAVKKTFKVNVKGGKLSISFPKIKVSQAVISAIAIASTNKNLTPAASPGTVIKDQVIGGSKARTYPVKEWFDTGDQLFNNAEAQVSALPSNLYGAEWIQLPFGAQVPAFSFAVATEADVYIGINKAQTQPAWLGGFEDAKAAIQDDAGNAYNIYKKRVKAGSLMEIPATAAYTLAMAPASNLAPAFDLKPTKGYKAHLAKFTSGIKQSVVNTKDAVTFNKPAGDTLEWTIAVGVGDTYSLTVKYANTTDKPMAARLQLVAADGTLMKEENVQLLPSRVGKWNYLATSSGSMINAGTYKVKLISVDAQGLSISGLDVQ